MDLLRSLGTSIGNAVLAVGEACIPRTTCMVTASLTMTDTTTVLERELCVRQFHHTDGQAGAREHSAGVTLIFEQSHERFPIRIE